jgi:tetratricopeptide (TPR) repeat protein
MKILLFIFTLSLTVYGQSSLEPIVPSKEVAAYREVMGLLETKPVEALSRLQKLPVGRSAIFDYLEGALLLNDKKLALAEKSFLKALKKFPHFYRVHLSLVSVYLSQDDSEKALTHLYEVVKSGRADGDTWKNIVYCHINNKSYQAAEEALENVRIFLPKDKSLDKTFLDLYLQQSNYVKALPLALELLDKTPKEKANWQSVINCYLQLEKPNEALRHYLLFERVFKLSNTETMQLAGLLYNHGLYKQASLRYAQITGDMANRAILNRASCFVESEDFAGLLDSLKEKLKKAKPAESEKYHLLRGDAYRALNKIAEAKKEYLEALKYNSTNATTNFNLAQIFDKEGDYPQALQRYEKSLGNSFYRSSAYMRKARIYVLQKEYTLALDEAEKALAIDDSQQVKAFCEQIKKLAKN